MNIKRENCLKSISESFSRFSDIVTLQNKAGFTDINKSAEKLFIYILNKTYNKKFQDINDIQDNYPAIDLADFEARICVQVTSESTNSKFRKTVSTFKEKKLSSLFDVISFLIISNKDKCTLTDKDVDTFVFNLLDVYNDICKLDDQNVYDIDTYLTDNLVSRIDVSDSILPSNTIPRYSIKKPESFLRFLEIQDDEDLVKELLNDLKEFHKVISELTKNEKEYLYYIVKNSRFPRNRYGNEDRSSIYISLKKVEHIFGDKGYDILQVLRSQELLWLDDEYSIDNDQRYITIIVPFFRGEFDANLFVEIKRYCNGNEYSLASILLECDFSCLE
ncbi:SMEK domain-containing protein [Aeromonas rivipollensis]|uniref:SMEK domain-containing protein n=1 Tax=Aeromonas rivipollensis TaxID=948519 RepID=UPI003D2540FF